MQHYMVPEVEWQVTQMNHGPAAHLRTDAAVVSTALGGFNYYLHEREHVRQHDLLSGGGR